MKLLTPALLAFLSLATAMPLVDLARSVTSPPKGKWFDRFVVVVFENNNKDVTFGEPYFLNLTTMGMSLGSYYGTTHPSQPNYITMISNTIAGGVYTDADHNTTQMSVIDLFEPAGITWRAYMEGYKPLANGECNPYSIDKETNYVRKHNPFMSFDNIRNNTSRCKNIVNAEEHFARDVSLGADAPQYMYYTPNLLNDAHNTNVSYAARDLRYIMDTMLSNPAFMKNTLITITFDENDIFSPENFGTPNHIYTVLLGNDTLKCYNCIDQQYYNHFSQVVTLEKNWNLTTIPQPDGSEEGWDKWFLPFGMLRTNNNPPACPYTPCQV
ncbi:uncharacterized protein PV06_09142 [Exophiala oligosperma]|uniref:Acid phosphatase n=2 Tax=Chaetothyriales TaxID=34395 RepID=A0A0D2AGY3_9EURO|nr:uncharacterized protein PV06_09142 [Exophiala oligosperma]KAJ9643675.1 hypothetical protein H2204_001820 [Knufia peltigerae]KIW39366.1 hypothetical protein PV06_09142 [Exophiala oligosperma]